MVGTRSSKARGTRSLSYATDIDGGVKKKEPKISRTTRKGNFRQLLRISKMDLRKKLLCCEREIIGIVAEISI